MFISLNSPVILRNVFNRKLCLFTSVKKGILFAATKQKVKSFKKSDSVLVISSFVCPEEFKSNSNLSWSKFSYSQTISSFDTIIIFYEDVNENLRDFIYKILQSNRNVFVVVQNNQEDVLQIFKQNGKEFAFFNCGYDGIWRIKTFRKIIPFKLSRIVKLALEKDPNYWLEKDVIIRDSNRVDNEFETFPDFEDEEDLSKIDLTNEVSEKKNSNFDSSVNDEEPDFLPFDDEDIDGGLF